MTPRTLKVPCIIAASKSTPAGNALVPSPDFSVKWQHQKSQDLLILNSLYKYWTRKLLKPCSLNSASSTGPLGLYRTLRLAHLKIPTSGLSMPGGSPSSQNHRSCCGTSNRQALGFWAQDKMLSILLWRYRWWILLFPRMLLKLDTNVKVLKPSHPLKIYVDIKN